MDVVFAGRKAFGAAREGQTPFAEVLATSDVISLHCPLNAETENLISDREFALMAKKPLLINSARGGIVDEEALERALNAGLVAGAGIDVTRPEPPPADSAIMRLARRPNVLVTPHVGWASFEAQQALVDQLGRGARKFCGGRADEPAGLRLSRLIPRGFSLLPRHLEMQRLGDEGIERAGHGVDEARRSAQEDAAREEDAEEVQRRVEHQLQQARFLAGGDPLLRLKPCVKNLLGELRVEAQAALVAQQAAFDVADLAFDHEILMHQRASSKRARPRRTSRRIGSGFTARGGGAVSPNSVSTRGNRQPATASGACSKCGNSARKKASSHSSASMLSTQSSRA